MLSTVQTLSQRVMSRRYLLIQVISDRFFWCLVFVGVVVLGGVGGVFGLFVVVFERGCG